MKVYIYKDIKKEWRWRVVSRKKIVADSGEGYKNKSHCRKMVDKLFGDNLSVVFDI